MFTRDEEPPKKKLQLGNSVTKLPAKPSLLYQGSTRVEKSNGNHPQSNRAVSNNQTSTKSKLYEQLCKSNVSTSSKTPFAWNPDLEIEVLEPASDDLASKQRIEELGELLKLDFKKILISTILIGLILFY